MFPVGRNQSRWNGAKRKEGKNWKFDTIRRVSFTEKEGVFSGVRLKENEA